MAVTPKLAVLKAAMSQLAGLGRKIVPLTEEEVLGRVASNADDIANSIATNNGVSFSPRLNRILSGPDDYGHMMAVVKEGAPRLPVDKESQAAIASRVLEAAQDPKLLMRLRRGENLGGWIDEDSNLVMDPSVRHLNRDVSILRGGLANQDSGFSLMDFDEYKLTDELKRQALKRLLAEAAVGGGSLATGGYLSSQD
jgi:hypothetical protein